MNVDSLLNLISGTAGVVSVLVIVLALILADRLHTHGEFERMEKTIERKDQIIEEKDKTIEAATARADAAVKAAEMIADAFSSPPKSPRRRRVPANPP